MTWRSAGERGAALGVAGFGPPVSQARGPRDLVAGSTMVYGALEGVVKARVTFRDPHIELEVPVGCTLLEAATMGGAPLGTHCGGVGACASCHVRIEHGEQHLSATDDVEEDGLDRVFDVRPSSRLGCRARIVSAGEIVVRITEESLDAWLREHPPSTRGRNEE